MKQKKFNKKLSLSKTTIANLGNDPMSRILGGATEPLSCVEVCYPNTFDECPETEQRRCDTDFPMCAPEH
jgi:hypothetical protein